MRRIREDIEEVQRLMRQTMARMGISQEQLDDVMRQIIEQLGEGGGPASPGAGE